MISRPLPLTLVFLLALLTAGTMVLAASVPAGVLSVRIPVQGVAREFLLYTPPDLEGDSPRPLVIALHGYRGSDYQMMQQTGLNRLANRQNFLVVYPQAKDTKWNARSNASGSDASTEDVEFIQKLIAHVQTIRNVDARRIYAVGFSNGGFFTLRLACEKAGQIAAFATVSATMGVPLSTDCHPGRPVPLLMMHSDKDPIVMEAGQIERIRFAFWDSKIMSFQSAVDYWVRKNECEDKPILERITRPEDGTTWSERRWYKNCRGNAEIQQWILHNGGHPWPGAVESNLFYRWLLGPAPMDVNASEVIWQFFSQHALPERETGSASNPRTMRRKTEL